MATQAEIDSLPSGDYFHQTLPNYYRAFVKAFRKTLYSLTYFHTFFISAFIAEIAVFVYSLPSLYNPSQIAIFLSSIFITGFTYLVTYFYLSSKKPLQMLKLEREFSKGCRTILGSPKGIAQHHLTIAETLSRLSGYLDDFEWNIHKVPSPLQFMGPAISRLSAFIYFSDVFTMKQMLLSSAIEEHIKQIRLTPTDLEVHASLGSTYVTLSKLYRRPTTKEHHPKNGKIAQLQSKLKQKSDQYSHLAIEEFKILSHYAANDPWVHEQMAAGYHDLELSKEEIEEVEILLKLKPHDKEILYRLGCLYFATGQNAKGLQIYEELKKTTFKKAEDLIASYGSFEQH